MSVKIRQKGQNLYLDVIQNRQHHWESLHIKLSSDPTERKEQMKLAEICRAKREMQLVTGAWNLTDATAGKQTLTNYMKNMQSGMNEQRKKSFGMAIKYVEKYKYGNVQLSSINARWVQDFQNWLVKETGLSQSSANTYSTIVRQALSTATKERIISFNPAETVKAIPIVHAEKEPLTLEEVHLLVKTPPHFNSELQNEVKNAFLFSCYTSLRVSDLRTLTWGDIETKRLTQQNSFLYWIKKRQIKTKKIIEIPLIPSAWELIKTNSLQLPQNFVFPLLANTGHESTEPVLKKWAKKAGIEKNVSWHIARHTFATLASEGGIDPLTIQRILGHSKIDVTAIYAATTEKAKSKAAAELTKVFEESDEQTAMNNA